MSSDRCKEPGADLALYGNARWDYCGNRGSHSSRHLDFIHKPIILDGVNSAQLLSNFERCFRSGFWSRSWQKRKMSPLEMLTAAVNHGLTEGAEDPGESAGEHFVSLASNPGLELADSQYVYRCAMNHASVADLLVTAIRSKWQPLTP